jgi:hypothetical protein
MPETITPVNKKVVIAPSTALGIDSMMAANLAITPSRNSQQQHATPARRDAQRDSEITPLFCAYVVTGVNVASAPQNEFNPSANVAP